MRCMLTEPSISSSENSEFLLLSQASSTTSDRTYVRICFYSHVLSTTSVNPDYRLPLQLTFPVGGVAQWLGRQSLAGGLSLIYG